MIRSMTGYGSGEEKTPSGTMNVTVRCVNARYLETRFNLQPELFYLEQKMSSLVKKKLARGAVDVRIETKLGPGFSFNPDFALAQARLNAINAVAKKLGFKKDVPLELIFSDDAVIGSPLKTNRDVEATLIRVLKAALESVDNMRRREGANLASAIEHELEEISSGLLELKTLLAGSLDEAKRKVLGRLEDLSKNLSFDETRLEQEAAFLVTKWDVTEETSRLESHIAQFRTVMAASDPVGRKLDFLAQEMYREANTIASKVSRVEATHKTVEIKAAIDRLREQVQNVL
ncbi:MAG: YicC family protein [Deltaproteobacteria bacterium]|nr:YicC family protein [Deltaproteobacteria bacterium]